MTKTPAMIVVTALALAAFVYAAQPGCAAPRPPDDRASAPPADPAAPTFPLGPQRLLLASGPDLVVEGVALVPLAAPSGMFGSDMMVTVTVRNRGMGLVEGFYTGLRLDHGRTPVVQWCVLEPLAAGEAIALPVDLQLGTTPNTLRVYVDPPSEGLPRGCVAEGPLLLAELNNEFVQLYSGDPAHPYR